MSELIGRGSRLAVAIGGFLIMMGLLLLVAVTLTLLRLVDASAFVNETYLLLFMLALLSVGVLDVIAAVVLLRG